MQLNIEKLLKLSVAELLAFQDKAEVNRLAIRMMYNEDFENVIENDSSYKYYSDIYDSCENAIMHKMEDVFGLPDAPDKNNYEIQRQMLLN